MKYVTLGAGVLVAVAHVAHPFLHHLEGGALDATLMYLTVWYDQAKHLV